VKPVYLDKSLNLTVQPARVSTGTSQDSDARLPKVEIFRTDVTSQQRADGIVSLLSEVWPELKFNFDLDDCDNVLRIEYGQNPVDISSIITFVKNLHCSIELLE
jgi:hypothetical protein